MTKLALVWDTETSGLTRDRLPASDPSQPHLVQIAASLIEVDGTERACMSMIVKPDGYEIPIEASGVHGITTDMALRMGLPLRVVIAVFTNLRALADESVCHNATFDHLVVDAQIARLGITPAKGWPKQVCTMRGSSELVGLPPTARMVAAGFTKFKPPSLMELHKFLFNEGFDGAHDALTDCKVCAKCFIELRKRKVLL